MTAAPGSVSPVWVQVAMTAAPLASTTSLPSEVELGLGPLCSWARSTTLCYSTIIPCAIWIFLLAVLLVYCFRTSNINQELGRLPDWTSSQLVPHSFRQLGLKKQNRIFNKLRKIPVASLFARLRLGSEFLEGCASEGVASLGDLMTLPPMLLRGLGFGAQERQLIARCIESRAQTLEDARHASRDTQIAVRSTLVTLLVEANSRNHGDTEFYVTRPQDLAMRRHMTPDVALAMSPTVRHEAQLSAQPQGVHPTFATSSGRGDMCAAALGLVSEEVSRVLWDLFLTEVREDPVKARKPPCLQLMCGRRESMTVSTEFYLAFRRKWFVAQQTPVVVGIQVQSSHRYLVERFRPQYFRANQQFWLGFVLRWNQHEAEIAQDRETKVLATGDAVLHRAGTVDPGAGISNTSFGITSDTSEHAAGDASNDDDNDEEWIDAFVAEFADAPDGAAQAIQRMKHETFSVRVQLVKMGSALSQLLDANNDAAHRTSGPDLPCNGLPPTALEKEIDSDEDIEDDDDDDARLFREVYFDTSVAFWNKYVHEFQAGELGVADDGEGGDDGEMAATTRQRPQHSADTGRGNCRVLLRVVNDNVRRRSTGRDSRHGNSSNWGQHSPASPSAESAEDNEVLAATRQRQKELRRLRGVSVVWKHMLAPQAPDADAAEGVI